MPWRRSDYPPNWPELRATVRERSGDACEQCGVQNHAIGARDRFGDWHDANMIEGMNSDVGFNLFGPDYPRFIAIVCTTAHLYDDDKDTQDIARLSFLCQKCHLARDRKKHLAKAAATRTRKKNQLVMTYDT